MRTYIFILLFGFLFFGCAHHRDVRPGAEGIHHVVTRGPEKEEVEQDAIRQAEHFCKEFGKYPGFLNEGTQYTGDMDEKTHKTARKASKAAMVVGSAMNIFGGRNESGAGAVVGTAGAVGSVMTGGSAYTSDMKFKCQ